MRIYIYPEKVYKGDIVIFKFYNLKIENNYSFEVFTPEKFVYPIYEIDKFTSLVIAIPQISNDKIKYILKENGIPIYTNFLYVYKKDYKKIYLTVSKKFDKLNKALLRRIKKEKKQLTEARKVFSSIRFFGNIFLPPVPMKRITSYFGETRIFNKKRKSIHSGIDISADTGTIVYAPYPGRVLLTGNFYYGGKTIIIDHGLGVTSSYSHLSEILVKKGDLVYQGEMIGKVGKTGRATGPHLHFAIYVNGIPTDPLTFIKNIRQF